MSTPIQSENRFDNDASRYAAYLESPEGRLRTDLCLANLMDVLPAEGKTLPLRALDVGCGTGAASVRLAQLGMHVTLLDSSAVMLELAEQAIATSGMSDKATFKCGSATDVASLFPGDAFDVILCHNLLEFIEDPGAILRDLTPLLMSSFATLSVLVRNQAGEVLKAALQSGDLSVAENNLSTEWGQESLYKGRVRFFTPDAVEAVLEGASLKAIDRRGVRIVSDYLPSNISRSADYEQIFRLERKLARRSEFFGVARYLHYLVRSGETQ